MGLTKERIKRTSTERGRYGDGGGVSAWNRRDRSTGLTRPRYPGNRMGELCCCSRLHGERSVYVCVCLCGYKCIKSNTGFLSANNKAHGFTWLCWDLEIHCGSTFSSQRRVYAFCTEECQQPWGFLQRVTGSSWGIRKPEFHKWSLKCKKIDSVQKETGRWRHLVVSGAHYHRAFSTELSSF